MKRMHVKLTFIEPVLGTWPSNQNIAREFIASKSPDAASIEDTVASAPLMAGETAVRSVQNAAETGKNWNELQESVKSDDRQWKLLRLMTGGKTQYAGRDNAMQLNSSGVMAAPAQSTGMAYTDEELKAKGYSQSEIDRMRARISGAKVSEGIDPEKSLGYQMYKRGQQLNEAAQAGMSPIARQLMGVTTSAAENLAVAGISPALVLPVLSAQGGAESMGQSIEKGESAGKTLAGGLAKFGAGWAINSVGAADLARTMGSDYAKDTLAGKLADMVRSVADNGVLAQQYPTVANAGSGGIDNAMQAFVETYADKAIDATLGDSEAAADLFKSDTFLTALESGLTAETQKKDRTTMPGMSENPFDKVFLVPPAGTDAAMTERLLEKARYHFDAELCGSLAEAMELARANSRRGLLICWLKSKRHLFLKYARKSLYTDGNVYRLFYFGLEETARAMFRSAALPERGSLRQTGQA